MSMIANKDAPISYRTNNPDIDQPTIKQEDAKESNSIQEAESAVVPSKIVAHEQVGSDRQMRPANDPFANRLLSTERVGLHPNDSELAELEKLLDMLTIEGLTEAPIQVAGPVPCTDSCSDSCKSACACEGCKVAPNKQDQKA